VIRLFARRRADAEERIVQALPSLTQHLEPWTYGLDLMRRTRLRSARFYTALRRLEDAGTVEATWEDLQPGKKHRRRMYRLTEATRKGTG